MPLVGGDLSFHGFVKIIIFVAAITQFQLFVSLSKITFAVSSFHIQGLFNCLISLDYIHGSVSFKILTI